MAKIMPSEFETVKGRIEKYAGISSVDRTEYDDIITIKVTSTFRMENYRTILEMYGLELTHIDFKNKKIEFIKR